MDKMQILFPHPQLQRLRELSKIQDRPVSELVRTAVEVWLERFAQDLECAPSQAPLYHGGSMKSPPDILRDMAYQERI